MSRFALKIYLVLLIMGGVPLIVAAVLSDQILSFNASLQREALQAIKTVSDVQRAWLLSEASRARLITTELLRDPDLMALPGAPRDADGALAPRFADAAQRSLQRTYRRYPKIMRYAAVEAQGERLFWVGDADPDEAVWQLINSTIHDIESGDKIRLDQPAIEAKEGGGPTLRLIFGIPQEFSTRFETLGDKRVLLRALILAEEDKSRSMGDLRQIYYLAMLLLVAVLTVALAVLITAPVNRRVARLASATQRVAAGDLTVQIPVKGRDEISQLTAQFNVMVSDLHNANNRLKYLERVSAWQEVARRLAHEIKNPLTPLQLAIQQLDHKFDDYHDNPRRYRALVSEVVEIVTEEVETLQKLVKEFSEFARLPALDPKPQRLARFVARIIRVNPQFAQQATLEFIAPDDEEGEPLWVKIDNTLMRRVLVNIIQNAIEAVAPTGRAPELRIECARVPGRDEARVVIADNGPGIKPEHIERLFEPYFTTKDTGTGLGLAIVRKIVIDHGGDIHLSNRVNSARFSAEYGALARIELPLCAAPEGEDDAAKSDAVAEEDEDEDDAMAEDDAAERDAVAEDDAAPPSAA